MYNFVKMLYGFFLSILPDKIANYIIFFKGYKKILNLENPKYFGEKIQWLKLYGNLESVSKFVDKFEVRKYVEKIIGRDYLFDIYGVYDKVDDINFSDLPEKFVIKCTNGSQAVLICKDKNSLNIKEAKKKMNRWMNYNFYKLKKEPQYKNIKNRIIIEKYMEDDNGELKDYKFYCYNGEPMWFSIFRERFTNKTIDTYDANGNLLVDCKNGGGTSEYPLDKPENLSEMLEICRKLSKPFTFVRVDLYLVNNSIYFGELTFTDAAGSDPIYPLEKYDIKFAKEIELRDVLKYKVEF